MEAGEVLARPGSAGALLARVQLFCRDFSAAGEQVLPGFEPPARPSADSC